MNVSHLAIGGFRIAVRCDDPRLSCRFHSPTDRFLTEASDQNDVELRVRAMDDRVPGGHPVVVLGHGAWVRRFAGDPTVVGRAVMVNGHSMTIVGVAQKGFLGEKLGNPPDIFVPLSMKREMTPDWDAFHDRLSHWLPMFGRLKPDVTREQAQAAMNVLYRAQLEEDIKLHPPGRDFLEHFRAKKLILKPGQHGRGGLRQQSRTPVLLMGMTLLVLVIACANVANLQLARAAARTREVAVRLAMGASRLQLLRGLLAESCVLALAGGLLGIAVAQVTRFRLVLPLHHGHDGRHAGHHPAVEIARLEAGGDLPPDDPAGHQVGQLPLQAAPHLDPDLPLLFGDQEDGAVVQTLLADPPVLGHLDGVLLQVLPLQGRDDEDNDLGRVAPLEVDECLLQPLDGSRREYPGVVVDMSVRVDDSHRLDPPWRVNPDPRKEPAQKRG